MTMARYSLMSLGSILLLGFVTNIYTQDCVLKVGAWESYPQEKNAGGTLYSRKASVLNFTSTATNQKTQKLYRGAYVMGYAYYENMPEGDYKVTIRKPGFKTTIQSHVFSCESSRDGIDFVDVLVFPGNPKQTVMKEASLRLDFSGMQEKCGLRVAGYDDENPDSFITAKSILDPERLSGITAYAEAWQSRKRFNSVPVGDVRFFGDLPEGDYRIFVGKKGYKTTVYGFHLSCTEASEGLVTTSIRLWPGTPTQIVNYAKVLPSKRENVRTMLGTPDTNTSPVSPSPPPRTVSGGVLNGKALILPKPAFPAAARAVRASGAVSVLVLINESGEVISAAAISGHPLLRDAAEVAARAARFDKTTVAGEPVKVSGVITYNFVP